MPDSHAAPDLNALSKAELQALQRQVQIALENAEARRRQDALAAVEQSIEPFGFTLREILTLADELAPKRAGGFSRPPAKFRNPENPQETWSGRGRRPLWFNAQIQAGKNPGDMQV